MPDHVAGNPPQGVQARVPGLVLERLDDDPPEAVPTGSASQGEERAGEDDRQDGHGERGAQRDAGGATPRCARGLDFRSRSGRRRRIRRRVADAPFLDRVDQVPRFRRGLRLQVGGYAPGKRLVVAEGRRPVAHAIQQLDQPAQQALFVGSELGGSRQPGDGALEVFRRFRLIGERRRRPDGGALQAHPLLLQPLLEVGRVGHVEPRQQRAPVELDAARVVPALVGLVERPHIAPEPLRIDGELLGAPAENGVVSECPAEVVHRTAQRLARVGLVGIGPEQRQ